MIWIIKLTHEWVKQSCAIMQICLSDFFGNRSAEKFDRGSNKTHLIFFKTSDD